MAKYNFHVLKGNDLPDNINEPVHKVLIENLKCPEAAAALREFEKHKNCGEIQIVDKLTPRVIRIKTNYGMVEGYDLLKTFDGSRYTVTACKHIKNHMITMKKD